MESVLSSFYQSVPLPVLLALIAIAVYVLSKGADLLVDEAVALSRRLGVPAVIIGATIVSLGTTLPEAAVSVLAAVQGNPDLALGNSVGSIICDTGLILGLAALISPLPLQKSVVNRQGWLQLAAGFLLVFLCFPWGDPGSALTAGGTLSQVEGFILVALLIAYIYTSIKWVNKDGDPAAVSPEMAAVPDAVPEEKASNLVIFGKLVLGIAMVLVASQLLIPAVEETAYRFNVPDSIVAATLVAFGTSLPELVTALTSVRKGHGELAVGNVIGADILNVLFVSGVAAAVTPTGLNAGPFFFSFLFPAMLVLLVIFRIGIFTGKTHLSRGFGALMLVLYVLIAVFSYTLGSGMK